MVTSYKKRDFFSSSLRREKQMERLDSWGYSASETRLCFQNLKCHNFTFLTWPWSDLTLHLNSPKWSRIARGPSPSYSTWKITDKRCATLLMYFEYDDILWPEHDLVPGLVISVKHSLNQFLPLWFRSIWRKFWPKTASLRPKDEKRCATLLMCFEYDDLL